MPRTAVAASECDLNVGVVPRRNTHRSEELRKQLSEMDALAAGHMVPRGSHAVDGQLVRADPRRHQQYRAAAVLQLSEQPRDGRGDGEWRS